VPRLDLMEDRTLLSTTFTVSNLDDQGPGSLRQAISNANDTTGADVISFARKLHGTIKLTSAQELKITDSLTITGPGANNLIISGNNTGNNTSRVFEIGSGATVTFTNLTIANGQTTSTGTSGDALGGGGILNDAGATLNLTRCSVVNNKAIAGAGFDVFGGGLLNLGTANVTACTFMGNQALNGNGTFVGAFAGSQGGAIDNFGGDKLTVDYSTFINNQAIGAGGTTTTFFGVGGAIENNNGSTANISYSTFTGNLATAGTGGTGNGGAICSEGSGATVTLTNSTLAGNRSIGGPGGNGETTLSQGLGGGILNGGGSKLTVRNSTLIGNQAIGGAHSTPTTDNPLTGAGSGGGIANIASGTPGELSFIVSGSTFINNLAQGGAGAVGFGGSGVGGGIENSFSSTATITNSTLIGNQAIAGPGGSGASVPTGLGFGGGIDDSFSSTATITNSTLIGNQAIGSDGSSGANGGAGWGGGIVVGINNLIGYIPAYFKPDTSSLIVSGSTLIGNRAQGGAGGSGFNGGNGWGGGLMIDGSQNATATATATVEDTSIIGNLALGGAAGAGGNAGEGVGGGVYNNNGVFNPHWTFIKGNHASTRNDNIFP